MKRSPVLLPPPSGFYYWLKVKSCDPPLFSGIQVGENRKAMKLFLRLPNWLQKKGEEEQLGCINFALEGKGFETIRITRGNVVRLDTVYETASYVAYSAKTDIYLLELLYKALNVTEEQRVAIERIVRFQIGA